ncbi:MULTISPECIES: hypothetical protein [unclassified Rhizobium]|uniref:hypothetical protein n=1 Tax=unclassified Rhizobium TaxID=2613769 RepID=UPI001ADBEB92|nr:MULTISPECIES: hypothetical protein [unclassified Rhizobium]MBO9099446.1 hypothetical protein [Rhizobium sp. L58/93]QXZ87069.1 hypothetical protein J5287_21005 [Rhizobium sp. K1/93]QXZ92897.1 hypothetical protein J5280_19890 [Rhizobium sp. K15/93]
MKTRNDLIIATLELLQADGGAGQPPAPEDVMAIENIIDGKLAELNRRNIYWANDANNFDDEDIDPLAIILANTAAPKYGQARNPQSLMDAERSLREMQNSDYLSVDVTPSQYF